MLEDPVIFSNWNYLMCSHSLHHPKIWIEWWRVGDGVHALSLVKFYTTWDDQSRCFRKGNKCHVECHKWDPEDHKKARAPIQVVNSGWKFAPKIVCGIEFALIIWTDQTFDCLNTKKHAPFNHSKRCLETENDFWSVCLNHLDGCPRKDGVLSLTWCLSPFQMHEDKYGDSL